MILMDTCAIVWDALKPSELTPAAVDAIENADQNRLLMIADISIWEISMLIKKKRIEVSIPAADFIHLFLKSRNIQVQSITPEIAEKSVSFGSDINKDPADRIISATSIVCNAMLVTADGNLRDSSIVNTIW